MTRVSLSLSAALIGFVEASDRTRDEKEPAVPAEPLAPHAVRLDAAPLDRDEERMEWQSAPDVFAWVEASRLNLVKGLDQEPDKARVASSRAGSSPRCFPRSKKLDQLASRATTGRTGTDLHARVAAAAFRRYCTS